MATSVAAKPAAATINAAAAPYVFHFDAGCGRAVDLITGKDHDFGAGSEVEPFSAHFWKCER